MKKVLAMLLSAAMVVSLAACGGSSSEGDTSSSSAPSEPEAAAEGAFNWPAIEDLKVGYSQADLASTWRTVESDDMQAVADERGYEIVIVNAEGDAERQISDVESLLAQGCNVIVITAIDADAIEPALDACKAKGVPVIFKARGSNAEAGVDYATFYASDFVAEGRFAGEWVRDNVGKDTIKYAEIQGVIGGTDVRDRSEGFHSVVDDLGYEMVVQQSANWSRTEAQEIAKNVIQAQGGDIDVFYCHNDEMALGVTLACKQAGLKVGEDVFVLGVDGMYETFDAIKAGDISATVTCSPKFAAMVFDGIEAGCKGEKLDVYYQVEDHPVDAKNVDEWYHLGF